MKIIVGPRDHWFRGDLPDVNRPVFVRPAVRVLSIDDSPFGNILDRASDEIERRIQSHRERLRSLYRWPLDLRFIRAIYRAQKAGKWRLPRFRRLYPRHVLARLNRAIDRWIFDPEGNPTIDRLCYALFTFILLYLIAQILRG